jgi:hypothetical protein
MEGPVMIIYGIEWKYEGSFQVTDTGRASVSAIAQGVVQVVFGNVLQRKTCVWDCDIT